MSNKITKLITFTEEAWSKAEDIMKKQGLNTPQDAVRYALGEIAKDPAYVEIAKMRLSRQLRTPEEKASEKVILDEAKEKSKEQREEDKEKERMETGKGICRLLGGKITKNDKGFPLCTYNIASYFNPKNVQIIPSSKYVDELTESDLSSQFTDHEDKPILKKVVMDALTDMGQKWPS